MEWQLCLTLAEEPRCGVIGAPRPHPSPPCSLLRRFVLCLGPFSTAWLPFGKPRHPPLVSAPSFSSSSWGWGEQADGRRRKRGKSRKGLRL